MVCPGSWGLPPGLTLPTEAVLAQCGLLSMSYWKGTAVREGMDSGHKSLGKPLPAALKPRVPTPVDPSIGVELWFHLR